MKLLSKYNRTNILATVLVLLASGVCYYFIIHYVLVHQLDKDLKVEEQEILAFTKMNGHLPDPSSYKDQRTSFQLANGQTIKRRFLSINSFEPDEKESIPRREIIFPLEVGGKMYAVSISKSQGETEDLIKLVLFITLGIVLILLFVLFLINRLMLNKLWLPFNRTLFELQQFNLSNKKDLALETTDINEFADLNNAVKSMADRVRQDYDVLKNFTENASHEMQTPLAIINSKLDVLIQDEKISEQQMVQMQGMYDAISRLSKLNQSLLLLAKIENQQFSSYELIQLDQIIKDKLVQFEEFATTKNLSISTQSDGLEIKFNHHLADILVGNLLTNAIKYTQQKGQIVISFKQKKLTVSNTSLIGALDQNQVFKRFYRHPNTQQEGNGLGLSIVKQICDISELQVFYHFKAEQHSFLVDFENV